MADRDDIDSPIVLKLFTEDFFLNSDDLNGVAARPPGSFTKGGWRLEPTWYMASNDSYHPGFDSILAKAISAAMKAKLKPIGVMPMHGTNQPATDRR